MARAAELTQSRKTLRAVMRRVLIVTGLASALGQTYADLIRPTGSRAWSPGLVTVVAAAVAALATLLVVTTPPVRRRVGEGLTPQHAVAAVLVFVLTDWAYGRLFLSAGSFSSRTRLETLALDLPGALVWIVCLAPLMWRRFRAAFGPQLKWIDDQRPPTGAERDDLVRMPIRAATFVLPYWLMLGMSSFVRNASGPIGLFGAAAALMGTVMTWMVTAVVIYLWTERRLRPVFVLAFKSGALPPSATAGIRSRLLIAWGLGSGIPLFFLASSPILLRATGLISNRQVVNLTLVFLGVVGLVAGFFTIAAAARSLAEPMEEVKRGLERVREGDISAELTIDDAGEIGRVKVGFNEMVSGLRERAVLHDLFGRHVGTDVARRALEEGTTLGGEQRVVTVFFVDLIGSTALAERCTPAEVVAVLNRFFAAVVDAVSAEGGWVNKFEGDGALCVFGTPVDQSDHAAHALRAARRLRESLASISDAGIGIATGDVVAGNVGAEERYEYTVIGRPVNTAARLTDEAKRRPSRVLCTAEAVATAGAEADAWAAAGDVTLRGLAMPIAVFEPVSVRVA